MRFIVFLFLILIVKSSSAQNLSAEDGLDIANKISLNTSAANRNDQLFKLLDEYKASSFKSKDEFAAFLIGLEKIVVTNEPQEAKVLFTAGKELKSIGYQLEAFPFLYRTGEILKTSPKKHDFECIFYETIGDSYYYFGRFDEAENALLKGLNCSGTSEQAKININNTLGLIKGLQKKYDEAENYFRTALDSAKRLNNKAWYGVITGNLGGLYYYLNDLKKAEEYLNEDFQLSLENNEVESAINAYCLLVQIDLINNDTKEAGRKLKVVESLMPKVNSQGVAAQYYNAKTGYLEKLGDFENALINYRLFINLRDSLEETRSLVNFNNTEFQFQFEKTQAEIRLLEEKQKSDKTRIISLYIIAFIILFGSVVTIRQIAKRRKREKEILQLKNQQMETNLAIAKQELKEVLQNLINKNETVLNLEGELQSLHDSQNDQAELEKEQVADKLHSFTLLTDEDWMNFKRLFEKLHPGFFEYFQNNFEEITNAEVRLAALIKLNLENLEMSKALGISPDSVRKTNLRLRKRLDIIEQKELQKLIQSI